MICSGGDGSRRRTRVRDISQRPGQVRFSVFCNAQKEMKRKKKWVEQKKKERQKIKKKKRQVVSLPLS